MQSGRSQEHGVWDKKFKCEASVTSKAGCFGVTGIIRRAVNDASMWFEEKGYRMTLKVL